MKKMGKVAIHVMMIMLILVLELWVCSAQGKTETYAMTTVVVSLNYDTDTVEVEDFNGNVWAFNGCEDWQLFDVCTLEMDDNNTANIYDDVILSTRYNGWLDGWMERVCE